MAEIKHFKVVASLPSPLEPDSIYYVRVGLGYDQYVTNGVGVVVAYEANSKLDLESKVDKESGKQLSDENYTLDEKNKLASLENYDDSTVQAELDTKVDKVDGKQLSTEDYSTEEKNKLSGVEAGAQVNSVTSVAGKTGAVTLNKADVGLSNVDNTSDSNKPVSTPQQAALNLKLDADANAVSASKLATPRTISLSGDASGSTSFDGSANATIVVQVADDSHNHVISNVDGLQTELDSKVDKVDGKQLSDENYTLVEKNKLAGVAVGATKNATDAQLRARASHTGVQPISSVSGLQSELGSKATTTYVNTQLANKVDKVVGKELSTNDFTDQLRDKLASLEGSHFRGTFSSKVALESAIPTAVAGDYADVDEAGQDAERYIWDSSDSIWVLSTSKATPLTAAQIKQLYESNPDTNPFDDAAEAKLEGIADGATANRTDTYLLNRANHTGVQEISTVSGLTASLSTKADQSSLDAVDASKVDKVEGKGLSTNDFTTTEKTKLSGIQAGATANATNAQLRDRTTHTGVQPVATVEGLQDALGERVVNTDPRLTNSREWTASVVSQAEAQAGTATTARKWTAQRVRQAILAWWTGSDDKAKLDGIETGAQVNTVTSVAGKTGAVTVTKADVGLSNVNNTSDANKPVSTAQQAALDLKADRSSLGTAATRNVGEGSGNVMEVGAFGLGATSAVLPPSNDLDAHNIAAGLYSVTTNTTGSAIPNSSGTALVMRSAVTGGGASQLYITGNNTGTTRALIRHSGNDGDYRPWRELWHSGNSDSFSSLGTYSGLRAQATTKADVGLSNVPNWSGSTSTTLGTSNTAIPSQGAVKSYVDSGLSGKASTSTQVIAGTGLSGGGSLAANRTLNVTYGTAAGTAAQGNDSRLSNSREWTASVVPQAEAEAGTSTTARKWTAQRVSQAISALGLKIGTTASTAKAGNWMPTWANVTGKPTTFTPSAHTHSLSQITDAGSVASLDTTGSTTAFLRGDGAWVTPPNTNTTYTEITTAEIDAGTASTSRTITGRRMKYALDKKADAVHGHSISDVTGLQAGLDSKADTSYVNTQLGDKVDKTISVVAGTGLSGGGTLSANRTLNVQYGTTAGTAAQGNDSRLSNSREWTATVVSQSEAQAGTATTARKWTAQRVRQAIESWWSGSTDKTKLDGIATGATANASDAQLRARASHTGVQAISTVTGLQAGLDSKVDKVVGKELSANDFTNVLKTKLDSLPSGVGGLIPLSAGGTGATSAATARTALQLGTAATKDEGYFALRAGTATQNFTTKEVSTVAANIRATAGSEGVKLEYNHTTKSLDFNFY